MFGGVSHDQRFRTFSGLTRSAIGFACSVGRSVGRRPSVGRSASVGRAVGVRRSGGRRPSGGLYGVEEASKPSSG